MITHVIPSTASTSPDNCPDSDGAPTVCYPTPHPAAVTLPPALDRGRLLNLEASAGAVVVDCNNALARVTMNPKATFTQRNRAKVDLERAEAAKVAANAALDAVGRYGSIDTPHSDPWRVSR